MDFIPNIIFSDNICSNNCLYCGLRYENKQIERYNASPEEIIALAKKAKSLGLNTIVLQAGENNCYSPDTMRKIISKIKELDVAITLSLGEKTYEEYKEYKLAGANRYLLRIETTDEELYKKMHPNMSLKNRIKCFFALNKLRLSVTRYASRLCLSTTNRISYPLPSLLPPSSYPVQSVTQKNCY